MPKNEKEQNGEKPNIFVHIKKISEIYRQTNGLNDPFLN